MSAFHPFREITISWSKTQIFVIFLSVYFVCIFDYSFHATEEMVAKRTTTSGHLIKRQLYRPVFVLALAYHF